MVLMFQKSSTLLIICARLAESEIGEKILHSSTGWNCMFCDWGRTVNMNKYEKLFFPNHFGEVEVIIKNCIYNHMLKYNNGSMHSTIPTMDFSLQYFSLSLYVRCTIIIVYYDSFNEKVAA